MRMKLNAVATVQKPFAEFPVPVFSILGAPVNIEEEDPGEPVIFDEVGNPTGPIIVPLQAPQHIPVEWIRQVTVAASDLGVDRDNYLCLHDFGGRESGRQTTAEFSIKGNGKLSRLVELLPRPRKGISARDGVDARLKCSGVLFVLPRK